MGLQSLVVVVAFVFYSTINAQSALYSSLNSLFSSFLSDPVVVSAFAPVATNPTLLSSLESYIQDISTGTLVPTSFPAFASALPTDAQNIISSVFAKESSIIAANGGASALSALYGPIATSTIAVSNATSSTSVNTSHASITPAAIVSTTTNTATSASAKRSVASDTPTASSMSTSTGYADKSWRTVTICAFAGAMAVVVLW